MRCNYDGWTTRVVKSVTPKMLDTLKVMADGQSRTRADMLRAAKIEPNPGSNGFEKTDYFLYKQGLIEMVDLHGHQKVFKITTKGLEALK